MLISQQQYPPAQVQHSIHLSIAAAVRLMPQHYCTSVLAVLIVLLGGCTPLTRPPMFPTDKVSCSESPYCPDKPPPKSTTSICSSEYQSDALEFQAYTGDASHHFLSDPWIKSCHAPRMHDPHIFSNKIRIKTALEVGKEVCLAAENIRTQERHWRSAAETYGDTAQLSRRLRDVLAVTGVATSLNGVGKTSIYYGLAAVVADRFPDLIGAEKQQAIYLLSADTASCLHSALDRLRLSKNIIRQHQALIQSVERANADFTSSAKDLIQAIQDDKKRCIITPDEPRYPAKDAGEHLYNITTVRKKGRTACGPLPAPYLNDFTALNDRVGKAITNYDSTINLIRSETNEFSRLIEKTTYAVNADLARGDASNPTGLDLAQVLNGMLPGTAQSGGERPPPLSLLKYSCESRDFAMTRQKLVYALDQLNATNTQIYQQIGIAKKEAHVCLGIRSPSGLTVFPPDSVVTLFRESPSYMIRAEDEGGPPTYRLSGSGTSALKIEKESDGNALILTISVNKDAASKDSGAAAFLEFISRDGKRRSSPIQVRSKP